MQVSGRRMAYSEASPPNPRATVLFLPWMGGSRLGWSSVVDDIGQDYRALALDHRDTGDSEAFLDTYSVADLADDAAAFLTALNAAPAWVVGLSLGGMVAQQLALQHPELVRGLVLAATTPGGAASTPAGERGRAALFLPAELEAGERARQALALMSADGFLERDPAAFDTPASNARTHPQTTDSYKRQLRAVKFHDTSADLHRLALPTLVIHGDADPLIPLPDGQRLAAGIPGARLCVYPQTGHMPHIERPQAFLDDLRGFLEVHS